MHAGLESAPKSTRKETGPGATYEDLLAVGEHLVAEIVDGELITGPRPASLHARASSRLGIELGGPFDQGRGGPGGWILLDEPELHLHGDVLVPDLAGWRRARMPELPDAAAFELPPDWVCEVISPSSAAHDRAGKMPVYARERVGHMWIVDPIARTLEAYGLEGTRWVVVGTWRENATARIEPFEAIGLEVGGLWGSVGDGEQPRLVRGEPPTDKETMRAPPRDLQAAVREAMRETIAGTAVAAAIAERVATR